VPSPLNPIIIDCTDDLHHRFTTARPFRHVVIDNFLNPASSGRLIAEFPAFQARYAMNERGEPGRKAVIPQIVGLGPAYAEFDRLIRGREFLAHLSRITGIPELLYDPDYAGGGTHENLDGQELDPHVDFNYHPRTRWHRRLNLIVFLNPQWDESWGGCLELLRDPWAGDVDIQKVVPLANRAVIFETTESSWHGFRRIQTPPGTQISRKSIAVYFYTKIRPADEIAPSHGTLYFQRPLPTRLQAGYILREEDIEEIRSILNRRDGHIRFLYDREKEFSDLISGFTNSPSFRIGRALTWPARMLRAMMKSY
jgi:hypothetical protein